MEVEIEAGNVSNLNPTAGWIVGHNIPNVSDFRDIPKNRLSREVSLKWFRHSAGDKSSKKPISVGRSLAVLIEGGPFQFEFCENDDFRQGVRSVALEKVGDYVLWADSVHHKWSAPQISTVLTMRWIPADNDAGRRETLNELMRMLVSHDEIRRAWIQFLITIEAGVILALWALVSFGKELDKWIVIGGCLALTAFGLGTADYLLRIVHRVHAWSNFYQAKAAKIARDLGEVVFPHEKDEVDKIAKSGGHVQDILRRWKYVFYAVLLLTFALIVVSVWQKERQLPENVTLSNEQFIQMLQTFKEKPTGTNP